MFGDNPDLNEGLPNPNTSRNQYRKHSRSHKGPDANANIVI